MGAGIALLIDHADDDQLGAGASVAFLGGPALFCGPSPSAARASSVRR